MALPSPGPRSPLGRFAVAIAALLLAVASAVAALRQTQLSCTPDACVTVSSFPASRSRVDLKDVRGVEIHHGSGKQRNVHTVSIINTIGAAIRVHSSNEAGAAVFKRELEELLAGQRQTIEVHTPPGYWMLAFTALLALFAIHEFRDLHRSRGRYVRPAPSARAPGSARPTVLWVGIVVAAILIAVAGNLILDASVAGSTGVLQLECRHRCEFDGGTCMPGGAMELPLNPGDYTVRVWNPAAQDSWEAHTIRIELGQATRFVCEPGR